MKTSAGSFEIPCLQFFHKRCIEIQNYYDPLSEESEQGAERKGAQISTP